MTVSQQIAKHFRDVHFGGNWTFVNLQDTLKDVSWEQSIEKVYSFNTIATLHYHINYYVTAITKVLEGGPLDAKDAYSFSHPPIQSASDWEKILAEAREAATKLAGLIEQIPDNRLSALFDEEKYGTVYRNLTGLIEHTHYHLGQIVLIKKILFEDRNK
jgi:uncharacterized damage-inducible protein DinB